MGLKHAQLPRRVTERLPSRRSDIASNSRPQTIVLRVGQTRLNKRDIEPGNSPGIASPL